MARRTLRGNESYHGRQVKSDMDLVERQARSSIAAASTDCRRAIEDLGRAEFHYGSAWAHMNSLPVEISRHIDLGPAVRIMDKAREAIGSCVRTGRRKR